MRDHTGSTPISSTPFSLRTQLMLLVLVCAIPAALGYGVMAQHFSQRERNQASGEALELARALATAVDSELDSCETAAAALATSPSLRRGDFETFRVQAQQMLRMRFSGYAFVLSDGEGQPLLDTSVPPGQPLQTRTEVSAVRRVFAEGKPVLSDLSAATPSGQPMLSLDLPVWDENRVTYALGVSFRPERLGQLLRGQGQTNGLILAILDNHGVVIARTHQSQRYIGQPGRPALLEKMRQQGEGVISLSSLEGFAVDTSFSRAPHSGWTVAVSRPQVSLADLLAAALPAAAGGLAALLLCGLPLAWLLGGRWSRGMAALALPPDALGGAGALQLPAMPFREAEQVAGALELLAAHTWRQRQTQDDALAEQRAELARSHDLLRSVYATAPAGLALLDLELRFVAVNEHLAGLHGYPISAHLGRCPSDLTGQLGTTAEQVYRQVLESGTAQTGVEIAGALPSAPGQVQHWLLSSYPVFDAAGAVNGVGSVVLDISERKRIETRLRDSEEYFRVLYDSSPDAHMITTREEGFTRANPAAVELFGCASLEAFLALTPADVSPEFQADGTPSLDQANAMMTLAQAKGTHVFEWLHERVDGSQFHAEVSLNNILLSGQWVLEATVRDISTRKRTEQALRQSKQLLMAIVEHMPAVIFLKRADNLRYEMLNRQGELILGRQRADVIGRSDADLFPEEQAAQLRAADRLTLAGAVPTGQAEGPTNGQTDGQTDGQASGQPSDQEQATFIAATGETRYLATRKVVLNNEAGQPAYLLGVAIDVTERHRAESALRDSTTQMEERELFIRTITDNLPGMVSYWDAEQRCRFANKRYLEVHGLDAGRIGQALIEDVLGPAVYAVCRPHVLGVLAGQPQTFERDWLGPTDVHHHWASYIPDFDSAGLVRGFFVLVADITVLKRSELRLQQLNEELVQARDKAEAASSAKTEFVANMSHEIRTPMNAIIGLARLLEEAPLERRERSYLAKIKLATQALLGVLSDVLDFSKIEAGQMALERLPFQLDALLAGCAVLMAESAAGKGVELVFEVAPDVPEALVGDPLRLQQVLLNLVGNAFKFTDRGEVLLSVARGAPSRGQALAPGGPLSLEFTVRDTGIGIASQHQSRMFDAFSQGDSSTSRRYGGSGLGLALCRRLVALMGGSIGVRSELGRGAEFYFTTTLALADSSLPMLAPYLPEAPDWPAEAGKGGDAAGSALCLLIVDDNASVRRVLQAACRSYGWQADTAADGATALAMLARQAQPLNGSTGAAPGPHYDLLLLDSAMPGLDGIATLLQARATPGLAVPPVVLMVAEQASDQLAQLADGLELAARLSKPCTPGALLAAVNTARQGASPAPPVPAPTPLSGRLAGMRVLLVEDNPINQEVAQYILVHAGATVEIADNGQLAVDRLAAGARYDAVLMDIQMPVLNGYDATRAIRAMGLRLPIIAMTANAMADDRLRAIEVGTDGHIAKPIDVDEMISTLTALAAPAGSSLALDSVLLAPPVQAGSDGPGTPAAPIRSPSDTAAESLQAQLPNIDLKAALPRFGGDLSVFIGLLKRFENSHGDALTEIRRQLAGGQRDAAAQALHRLRGVAGNLGAAEVAALILEAEAALKTGNDVEMANLMLALDAAMASVMSAARRLAPPVPVASSVQDDPVSAAGLREALAELLALLHNNNMKALGHFQGLRPALEQQQRSAALSLGEAVETLSFEAAADLVGELLRRGV